MASLANESMVRGYRIVAPRWVDHSMTGEGARKYGGRWNSPGHRVVYLGGSRALAALEMLVHLTTPSSRAKEYRIIEVAVPLSLIGEIEGSSLPSNWQGNSNSAAAIGDGWLADGKQLAARVPSVLIPEEWNLIVNPDHPRFGEIEVGEATTFRFDPRL